MLRVVWGSRLQAASNGLLHRILVPASSPPFTTTSAVHVSSLQHNTKFGFEVPHHSPRQASKEAQELSRK